MLGGSTVFGYGVGWKESIPAQLESRLQARLGRPVTVVNLGFNTRAPSRSCRTSWILITSMPT